MSVWKCYYAAKDGEYECKEIDDEKEKPVVYLYKFKNGKFQRYEGHLCDGKYLYCKFYSVDIFGKYTKYTVPVHECRVYNNLVWLSVPADNVAIDIFLNSENIAKKCILEYLEKCEKNIEILNGLKGKDNE